MPTVISEIRLSMEMEAPLASLVRTYNLKPGTGNSLVISQRGRLTAQDLVAGVDMAAPQKDAISQVSFTPFERGAQVLFTDIDVRRAQDDVNRAYGRELGEAIGRKLDIDIYTSAAATSSADLGPGLANNFGTAGFTLSDVLRKLAALLGYPDTNINSTLGFKQRGPRPFNFVMHDWQWFDLGAGLTFTTNTLPESLQKEALSNYTIGNLYGINLFFDGNIPLGVTGAGEVVAVAFSKEGMILVKEQAMRIAPERDESMRGTELNAVISYAVGRYSDSWVRKLSSNVSLA